MILYHAISSFQLLKVMLHRMKFHKKEKAVLLLPDFIQTKYPDYLKIQELKIFDEVYLFPYLFIEHNRETLEKNLENAYNKNIPYNIHSFSEIYVAGIHFYFSLYLINQAKKFIAFEDAPNILCRHDVLYYELKKVFPVHAEIAKENKLFSGENKYIKQIIVLNKCKTVLKKQKKFNVRKSMKRLSRKKKNLILQFFISKQYEVKEQDTILLTQRFSVNGIMSEDEQINLYQVMVREMLDEKRLIIKPHPDETIDYQLLFPKSLVISNTVPSELLLYICNKKPKYVITIDSMAKEYLQKDFEVITYNLEDIKSKI